MKVRAAAPRLCHTLALLAAVSFGIVAGALAQQPQPTLRLEPGWRDPAGRLVIPMLGLDAQDQPIRLDRGDLQALAGPTPLQLIEIMGRAPAAVVVVSDQFLPAPGWATVPAALPGSPHWLGLRDAGAGRTPVLTPQPITGPAQIPDLVAPESPRVWDAVLAGLQDLALLEDAPPRRVLIVLGDLREEDASVRPMAACLEAALELAVPIYGALVGGAHPAAAARLQHLAVSSGGDVVTAASPLAALTAVLARIDAAQVLVLGDPGLTLPVDVQVSLGDGPSARTTIKARPSGRWAPGSGLVVAGAVVLTVGAALLGWWRWRRRAVGWLVAADPAHTWRCAIPAAGLSIGRDPDNGLTLAETRVSKHHAIVRWRRGQVQLIDLKSTNGTQVGGRAVRTAALADGDQIVFGDVVTVQFRRRAPVPRDRM